MAFDLHPGAAVVAEPFGVGAQDFSVLGTDGVIVVIEVNIGQRTAAAGLAQGSLLKLAQGAAARPAQVLHTHSGAGAFCASALAGRLGGRTSRQRGRQCQSSNPARQAETVSLIRPTMKTRPDPLHFHPPLLSVSLRLCHLPLV